MTDIIDELRTQCRADHGPNAEETEALGRDVRWQAAAEIERLRQALIVVWQPIQTAPRDEGPLLLFCPGLAGHVADEIVVGAWRFDENRRALGYWVSDVGVLDAGFSETGPWIEYPELRPECWARLPRPPQAGK